jgi:hypothetical protein
MGWAVAHLTNRQYGAWSTADKEIMAVGAPNFAKPMVIKPPNERLVAVGGKPCKQMRREVVL